MFRTCGVQFMKDEGMVLQASECCLSAAFVCQVSCSHGGSPSYRTSSIHSPPETPGFVEPLRSMLAPHRARFWGVTTTHLGSLMFLHVCPIRLVGLTSMFAPRVLWKRTSSTFSRPPVDEGFCLSTYGLGRRCSRTVWSSKSTKIHQCPFRTDRRV